LYKYYIIMPRQLKNSDMSICTKNCVQYNSLKTAANDPTLTKAMRYAQLVKNYSYRNVETPSKLIYQYKTPLFTNYFSKK